jgi:hypothetical protein
MAKKSSSSKLKNINKPSVPVKICGSVAAKLGKIKAGEVGLIISHGKEVQSFKDAKYVGCGLN